MNPLAIITEELIESHARSHIPYVLTSAPASIPNADGTSIDPDVGVCVMINSEVFGRIASASARTLEEALFDVVNQLLSTRDTRWSTETQT